MPVTIHETAIAELTQAQIDSWRAIPVAVAVDLGRDIGQIDPAIEEGLFELLHEKAFVADQAER